MRGAQCPSARRASDELGRNRKGDHKGHLFHRRAGCCGHRACTAQASMVGLGRPVFRRRRDRAMLRLVQVAPVVEVWEARFGHADVPMPSASIAPPRLEDSEARAPSPSADKAGADMPPRSASSPMDFAPTRPPRLSYSLRRGHPGAGESPERPTYIVPTGLIGRSASRAAVCHQLPFPGGA